MKATQFRIGNLIEVLDIGGGYWHELEVRSDIIRAIELEPERFRPIPLTAEWFQKFGYKGNVIPIPVERESEFRAEIIFDHLGDRKTFLVISTPDSDFFRVGEEIQFAHELQNRFQSLTKKELQTETEINQA